MEWRSWYILLAMVVYVCLLWSILPANAAKSRELSWRITAQGLMELRWVEDDQHKWTYHLITGQLTTIKKPAEVQADIIQEGTLARCFRVSYTRQSLLNYCYLFDYEPVPEWTIYLPLNGGSKP